MKKTRKAGRRKTSHKPGKRKSWRIPFIPGAALVLVVTFLLVLAQRRGQSNENPAVNEAARIKTINTTQKPVWRGSDPALGHEVGREGPQDSWNSAGGAGYLVTGPHVNLGPDYYMISPYLKVDGILNESARVGRIEITKAGGVMVLAREDLYGMDFGESGEYKAFPIRIVSSKIMEDVEFRVRILNGNVNLSLEKITMQYAPAVWSGSDPALTHDTGYEDSGNTWASGTGEEGYMLSGSPSINIAPGSYTISYTFMIDKGEYNDSERISVMEVSHSMGTVGMWNSGVLTGGDYGSNRISANAVVFKGFGNTLSLQEPLNDVKFKLYRPNSTVNVKLSSVGLYMRY